MSPNSGGIIQVEDFHNNWDSKKNLTYSMECNKHKTERVKCVVSWKTGGILKITEQIMPRKL